jgi:hypothetical protein
MAQLNGVVIDKLQGGLNRAATSTDSHVALIVNPVADVDVNAAIGNTGSGLKLTSLFAAESIGINAALDANEGINLHKQVVDFFRLAPLGTLYLFNSKVAADMIVFIKTNPDVKGFALQEGVAIVLTQPAVLAAQQLDVIDALALENRLIDFGIIGIDGFGIADAVDLRVLDTPQMSVCVASGNADSLVNLGALLGMIAARRVNENLASVNIQNKPINSRGSRDYPLTDENSGAWLKAYMADGTEVNNLTAAQLADLEVKGYIVAASYQGYAGVFFTNSHTAIDISSDYAYIENNRVWNKAARLIRATLIPQIKGVVKKDPATGFIKSTTASQWTAAANKALETMVINDEISGFQVAIDNKQIVNSSNPVFIQALIVADGIVHKFEVALGLTNSI